MMSFVRLEFPKFMFSSTLLTLTIKTDHILEKHAKVHYHNIHSSGKIDEGPISSQELRAPKNAVGIVSSL